MGGRVAFIGHRVVYEFDRVKKRLEEAICERIDCGCRFFTMGTHGEFDEMALSLCRQARKEHKDIEIEVALTSYRAVEKRADCDYVPYGDVNTVTYDVEDEHFKRRITLTNRRMIDACDTLICDVDEERSRSGARRAMDYAARKGLKIINVFRKEDLLLQALLP